MPKNPNTIQFSLPSKELEKLKEIADENESIGLVAKRLVLEAIGSSIDKPIGNSKLESLEQRLRVIEEKLSIDNVIDNITDNNTSFPVVEKLSESQIARALQNQFCVVSLSADKKIEKFWSGRDWENDLSKAKIFTSERGVTASVKNLKGKYKGVAFNSCDRLYGMLDERQKIIARFYWVKEGH